MPTAQWWPHTEDPRVASFRLRCRQIIDALRADGVDAGLYRPSSDPADAPKVLVLGKRYDPATLERATALRRSAGTRIVLDLCDNHFHVDNAEARLLDRARDLRRAVAEADLVIAASAALAEVVAAEGGAGTETIVIPDASEKPWEPALPDRLRDVRAEWAGLRLAAALRSNGVAPTRRLLWFGNHGSPGAEGGMADLLRIREAVEQAHRRLPLSLTVISNDLQKFDRLVRPWSAPTHYLAWKAGTFSRMARLHSAVVVPISPNPFTRCKTNNRVATAFEHGLNVVADSIPSYAEFSGAAVLDDWPRGLGSYLDDAPRRASDLAAGRQLLAERYSLATVSAQWRRALDATARPGGIA